QLQSGRAFPDSTQVVLVWYQRAWLALMAGRALPEFPADHFGRDAAAPFLAAFRGDSTRALVLLARSMRGQPPDLRAAFAAHLRAIADWGAGRWDEVIDRTAPSARVGMRRGMDPAELIRLNDRWMIADAFARLGHPDSATVYLELILDPPGNPSPVIFSR